MRPEWLRRLSPAYLALPPVIFALLWLGRSSYHYSQELTRRAEERERKDNEALGRKAIDRVEDLIIHADQTLFNLVNLDDPEQFKQLWKNLVYVSPAIEAAVVLDEAREIKQSFTKEKKKDKAARYEKLFREKILTDRDLALEGLPPDEHRHLHKEYDGKYYLLSYTRRDDAGGHAYYVLLKSSIDYIVGEVFKQEFAALRPRKKIEVIDEQGRRVYGEPVGERPDFEAKFPTTLYLWTLRMAPREAALLGASARRSFLTDSVLLGLALSVAFAGVVALVYAHRNERRLGALKSEFIANVSHELKTPLSLIRMFGEMIATGRVRGADVAREYGDIITRESERLSHLIDNVLDFARIERGKEVFEFAVGDLREVVERGLDVYRHRLEREKVRLCTEVAGDLPPVRMDENAMTLVLLNLVENAVRYGVRGREGEEIGVRLDAVDGHVRLSVRDHGPGVPPDEQKRIFERFYRARADRARPSRGSGIGLSLVKHIAEAHGGHVRVESAVGAGSTFTVELPVARAPEESTPARA